MTHPAPSAPPVIRKLEDAVVNKIAAGEVIQRPASALKELLENSLDAGATQITVVVKEGGCKLLQITDNGHGIRKSDLPILCHRHTTSKLKAFEDLETIGTLGFRGEALCSISFVSNMSVLSMTAGALHGWRVSYKEAEMLPPGPKAVASVQGTTITVEDLFYNVPTRRKALKSATEEYARVVDVVSRYAVFKTGVAFCCKRHGESRADVATLSGASRLDNIRAVYGPAVAKELLPLSVKVGGDVTPDMDIAAPCAFTLQGYVSSANYTARSSTFILFVNERCVECPPLRKAMEATYTSVLPKAGKPFMLLDLRLPPRHVEVNMHPTKREVGMLNQEEIIESVRVALEQLLTSSNSVRTFTQQTLPLAPLITADNNPQGPLRDVQNEPLPERGASLGSSGATPSSGGAGGGAAAAYRPHKLVRVDGRTQSLEGFLSSQYATPKNVALAGSLGRKRAAPGALRPEVPSMTPDPFEVLDLTQQQEDGDPGQAQGTFAGASLGGGSRGSGPGPPLGVTTDLDSVRDLAAEVESQTHPGLWELIRNHVLVGMADDTLALVQYQTKLYLVNVQTLSYDFFYQQVLRQWERCPSITLDPAPRVYDLMSLALDMEEAAGKWKEGPGASRSLVCDLAVQLLCENREMLAEYLGMVVDAQGHLCSIPQLLPGHTPDLGYLPDLVLALGREVNWDEEEPCFRGLAQVVAQFYSLRPPLMPVPASYPLQAADSAQTPGGDTEQAAVESTGALAQTPSVAAPDTDSVMDDADDGIQVPMAETAGATAGPGRPGAPQQEEDTEMQDVTGGERLGARDSTQVTAHELGARSWMTKQVLFPAFRAALRPGRQRSSDGTFVMITSLEKLYRTFERC